MRSRLLVFGLAIALGLAGLPFIASPAAGVGSANIVISQVYGGGGNAGATYKNDFIELFNRGTTGTSLSGWSVQYGASGGTTWQITNLTAVTLAPGQYYLVQEAPGAGGTTSLPTPDATGSIAMSATGAKVALVSSTTALSGACPVSASIIDVVGYDGANCFEGAATPTLSNTTAAIRKVGGCTDTDSNSGDFTVAAPTPRNTASPTNLCGGTPQVALTVTNAGGGTVTSADGKITCGATCTANYDQGATVVLTATPAAGAAFGRWTGACSGSGATCTLAMSVARAATAVFTEPLTISIVGTGTVTSSDLTINCPGTCTASFDFNTTVPITATPAAGWAFAGWSGDCGGTGTCFILMTASRNVTATFANADAAPAVTATSPLNGATDVPLAAAIQVTFSEPVTVSDNNWYTLSCTHGATPPATTSGGGTTFTITPTTPFVDGQLCSVIVLASKISDVDTNDPPDAMAADYTFAFRTILRIHDIQGASHFSAFAGETVGRIPGVVTAKRSNGFYIQDPDADGDVRTSEGIFVLASGALLSARTLGEAVTVDGSVAEFAFDATQLSITELRATGVVDAGTGPAIVPTVIGTGGRVPPTTVIENDASGSESTTNASFDPTEDGMDFYESLEGMLVQINNALTVSRTEPRFGELWVIGDGGANASVLTPRGGIAATDPDGIPANADFNPERMMVDDEVFKAGTGADPGCAALGGSSAMPCVNVGATFTAPLIGVMDYDFSTYRVQLLGKPVVAANPLTAESTVPQGPNELAIATFNVQNLAPSDPSAKYARLAAIIVNNLKAPDIIALEEIQDNSGATDNGIVAADQTFNKLISFITAAGGPTYQFRSIDPVNDQDGGAPGGNIRVGYIFRTDRGLAFVDRPGATSTTPNAVVGTGSATHLAYSPGRIDPNEPNGAWDSSRKPLAAEWTYNGHRLFTIANHFNSKLGDESLYGVDQPPQRSSEVQRHLQAPIVNDFVKQIETADPNADIVVLGDLNDFQFSGTVTLLKGHELHTLIDTLPVNERYTYVFEGNSEAIDHTLLSNHAFASVPWHYDIVHLNSEFADNASDHEPQVTRLFLPDVTAPVVTPPGDRTAEATSPSGAQVDYGSCTAIDDVTPQADLIFDYSLSTNATFPLGPTTIVCGATDAAGNRGTATFHVNVVDTTPPTIAADSDVTAEATSSAGAVVSYSPCTASDIASTPTVTYSQDSGTQFPLGTTTVTCVATDGAGLTASTFFEITVHDTTPPAISAPAPQTVEATGPAGAPATVACTATDLVTAHPDISYDGILATYPLGTTTVACTATDLAGNSASATTTITVRDTTAPAVTAPAPQTIEATAASGTPATVTCTATDAVTAGLAISYDPALATYPLGTTTVTCRATDASGNTGSATTSVTVRDTTKPTISGSASPAPNGAGWNNTAVTVHFVCADLFLLSCESDHTLTTDGAAQSATGTATDTSGNTMTATVGGINIDRTAPVVQYTGNATTYTVAQTVHITCSATDGLSGIATTTCADINGPASSFALGTNTFHATATDVAGNSTTMSTSFTVVLSYDSLCTLTRQLATDPKVGTSLCQKLANASAAAARGDLKAAGNIAGAYQNEIAAQTGKAFTAAAAALLRSLAGAF